MSTPFIRLSETPHPAIVAPTAEQKKAAKLRAIVTTVRNDFAAAIKALDKAVRAGIKAVNADPSIPPQEVWDAFGEDAAKVANGSGLTCQFLAQAAAISGDTDYVAPALPAGVTITVSGNTVTATVA